MATNMAQQRSIVMSCTEAVAESLVQELAKEPCHLSLSPSQQEIGIPFALIFIAGLVVAPQDTKLPFSSAETQRFQRLQQVYNKALQIPTNKQTLFQLSPMLLPTRNARILIQARIQEHEKKLAVEANEAAEQLMLQEKESKKKNRKKNKSKKKKQVVVPVVKEDLVAEETVDESSDEEEELLMVSKDTFGSSKDKEQQQQQHVLTAIQASQQEKVSPMFKSPPNDDSWVQVKTKRSIRTSSEASTDEAETNDENAENKATADTPTDTTKSKEESNTNDTVLSFTTSNNSDDAPTITEESPPPPPTTTTKDDDSHLPTTIQSLQNQVQDLQCALSDAQSQLQRERQSHKQEVKRISQDSEERIQSLQLRLYISETRSRNFEEALQNHVDAVAENVVLTPRKLKSDMDSVMKDGEEVDGISGGNKPLYSRVAGTNDSNDK